MLATPPICHAQDDGCICHPAVEEDKDIFGPIPPTDMQSAVSAQPPRIIKGQKEKAAPLPPRKVRRDLCPTAEQLLEVGSHAYTL